MSAHCPGCYEHWSVTTPTAGDQIPLVQAHPCPGCGHEAEIAKYRRFVQLLQMFRDKYQWENECGKCFAFNMLPERTVDDLTNNLDEQLAKLNEWVEKADAAIVQAVAQEREACAKVAEDHELHPEELYPNFAIANAIRARSK